jgi:hypothetical protein
MKRTAAVLSFICWQGSVALAEDGVDDAPVPEPIVAPPSEMPASADDVYPQGTVTVTVAADPMTFGRSGSYNHEYVSDDVMDQHRPGDQPNGYISAGAGAGGGYFDSKGFVLDAGKRIGRSSWFMRGAFLGGNSSLSFEPGRGTYMEARAGVEARACGRGGMVCGSAGLDAGIHREEFDHVVFTGGRHEYVERFDSVVLAPRVTLDAGGRMRFRVSVELPMHMRDSGSLERNVAARSTMPMAQPQQDNQYITGLAASFSLALGF